MPLTDTFVKQVRPSGSPAGDKHTDGDGMYLLVKLSGKYWRMNYRYLDKRKTLALGVYPAVSIVKARKRRDEARALLADGIDPGQTKRDEKQAKVIAASHTFESIAQQWLKKTASDRAAITQEKVTAWLKHDVFPYIGNQTVSSIKPLDILATVRRIEARGAIDSAHRVSMSLIITKRSLSIQCFMTPNSCSAVMWTNRKS